MEIKNKIYLLSGLFVAVFVLICIVGSMFIMPKLSEASQSLREERTNLARLEHGLANIEEFRAEKLSLDNYSSEIGQIFIDKDAPVGFLSFLEKEAQDAGLNVNIVPLSLKKEESSAFGVVFQVSSYGSPTSILSFLRRVETSSYLFEITEVNIVKLSDKQIADFQEGDIMLGFVLKTMNRK